MEELEEVSNWTTQEFGWLEMYPRGLILEATFVKIFTIIK